MFPMASNESWSQFDPGKTTTPNFIALWLPVALGRRNFTTPGATYTIHDEVADPTLRFRRHRNPFAQQALGAENSRLDRRQLLAERLSNFGVAELAVIRKHQQDAGFARQLTQSFSHPVATLAQQHPGKRRVRQLIGQGFAVLFFDAPAPLHLHLAQPVNAMPARYLVQPGERTYRRSLAFQ